MTDQPASDRYGRTLHTVGSVFDSLGAWPDHPRALERLADAVEQLIDGEVETSRERAVTPVDLRKPDVDLATAVRSRDGWRREYAELAEAYKAVYARAGRAETELRDTHDRVRKIHQRYADGTCFADGEPYPCPTINSLEPPQETPDA